MAPMENSLASVSISNGCCKSGNVRTGAVLILSFKVSKALWCLPPHWKISLTLFNACNGAVMEENPEMNFLQYWTAPRKLLISVTVLGRGQFTMTTTLAGSVDVYVTSECILLCILCIVTRCLFRDVSIMYLSHVVMPWCSDQEDY